MKRKAAILGTGNMGKGHTKRLQQAGAEVVAVCDNNKEARKQFLAFAGDGIRDYADF